MEFLRKNSLVILIIILAVISFWGYRTFVAEPEAELIEGEVPAENPIRSEVIRELNKLQSLKNIDGSLFASPVFQSFFDTNALVPQDRVGRPNPFAPIGR